TEWVEIGNAGDTEVDIGDYALADSDKATGKPNTAEAVRFPAGTKLAPGAHIVILVKQPPGSSVGPHPRAECLDPGPETCFWATFGVVASTGEALHLLAPDGAVLSSTPYPSAITPSDEIGQTVCRLPDLVGDLTTC